MDNQKEHYLLHARLLMLGFYTNLWRIFDLELKTELPNEICGYELSEQTLEKALQHKTVRDFFNRSDLFQWLIRVYEYGEEGIDDPSNQPEDEEESCQPFWTAFQQMDDFIENNCEFRVNQSFSVVNKVVEKYHARFRLDYTTAYTPVINGEAALFLTDLARLSDLDEKTIRNMASKKMEGFPTLLKLENRTYVSKAEARNWLISRGWKDTVSLKTEDVRVRLPEQFHSAEHMLEFLHASVQQQSALKGAASPEPWINKVQSLIEEGNLAIPLSYTEQWAKFIGVLHYDLAVLIQTCKHRLEQRSLLSHFDQN